MLAAAAREAPDTPVLRHLALVGFITIVAFTAFEATFALFGDRRFGLTEASTAAVFLGVGLVLVVIQGGALRAAGRSLRRRERLLRALESACWSPVWRSPPSPRSGRC